MLVIIIAWISDRPRKYVLRNEADKINALLDLTQHIGRPMEEVIYAKYQSWYPKVSQEEFEVIKTRCKEIEKAAYELSFKVRDGLIDENNFKAELSKEYPALNPRTLGLLETHAFWLSFHG